MSKIQKKEVIQKRFDLEVDNSIPLVILSDLSPSLVDLVEPILEGLTSIGIQLIVCVSDTSEYADQCQRWHEDYPDMIRVVSNCQSDDMVADMAIIEDLTPEILTTCVETSRVPIASGGLLSPFDPIEETGNGFSYTSGNSWLLFAAVVRALETYRFSYDWKNVLKAAKKSLASIK